MSDDVMYTGDEAILQLRATHAVGGFDFGNPAPAPVRPYDPAAWENIGRSVWKHFDAYVEKFRAHMASVYEGPRDGITGATIAEMIKLRSPLVMASTVQPPTFAGLDLSALPLAAYDLIELWPGIRHLTQDAVNFLTLRDIPDATNVYRGAWLKQYIDDVEANRTPGGVTLDNADALAANIVTRLQTGYDGNRLMHAFAADLIAEAAPHTARVVTGTYILNRIPLPQLDEHIDYEHIRLVITPAGMGVSIVYKHETGDYFYLCFWWSPSSAPVLTEPVLYPMANVLCAGIWRDACIVGPPALLPEGVERRHYSKSQLRRKGPRAPLILPRVVYRVQWSTAAEREYIAHTLHTVRGHYRALAEGWQVSDAAKERAALYGYPTPPKGYTFVTPHTRGKGETDTIADEPRRVICRGLYTVRVSLANGG